MRDIHTNSAPSKIVNLFSQTSYNTLKVNMYIKKFNLEKLKQAVLVFGAKLWNEIPGRMRDTSNTKINQCALRNIKRQR